MKRLITALVAMFLLAACAPSSDLSKEEYAETVTFESREKMLRSSGNQKALIDLYKTELKKSNQEVHRLKLVEAYIESADYESAAFHLEEIELNGDNVAEIAFLKAKVFLALGDIESAYLRAQTALSMRDSYSAAENLMGLIMAEKRDFPKAREYFLLAKKHFHDDIIIANNLAVIDLLEGNYQVAANRLQPLYSDGRADSTIKANLVLANAKLGRYQAVEAILKEQGYKQEQVQNIFVTLRKASSESVDSKSSTELDPPIDSASKMRVKLIKGDDYDEFTE